MSDTTRIRGPFHPREPEPHGFALPGFDAVGAVARDIVVAAVCGLSAGAVVGAATLAWLLVTG